MNIRIGILQCDHVDNDLVGLHGDYNDMFSDLLYAQESNLDSSSYTDFELAVYDLTASHFPIDLKACDAYIITGSRFSAYDTVDHVPWINKAKELVGKLKEEKIPTIGICFGHQLIAESLGGKVRKANDEGWGVGVHQWHIKEHEDWMGDKPLTELSLHASHEDQVVSMPAGSKLIATSKFCPVAGFQIGDHMLALQGHPEFTREYSKALIEKRASKIGKDTADAAKLSLKNGVDNEKVGSWMLKFIIKSRHR